MKQPREYEEIEHTGFSAGYQQVFSTGQIFKLGSNKKIWPVLSFHSKYLNFVSFWLIFGLC